MTYTYGFLLALCVFFSFGCKENTKQATDSPSQTPPPVSQNKQPVEYVIGTTDEMMASIIKNYLVNDYLKAELNVIPVEDRKFQFQMVDLNNDGSQEIFINFLTPYFCGTGGCTVQLMRGTDFGIINTFTVMNTPIMVEPHHKCNEWAVLMAEDRDGWKELHFKDGKYPSNPSLLPTSKYLPSGHAQVMFSDEFAPAKTFTF